MSTLKWRRLARIRRHVSAFRKARGHVSEDTEARNGRHEPPNAIRKAMDAVSIIGLHHHHAAAHHEPHRDGSPYPRHGQKKYAETHQRASAYPICLTTYFLNEWKPHGFHCHLHIFGGHLRVVQPYDNQCGWFLLGLDGNGERRWCVGGYAVFSLGRAGDKLENPKKKLKFSNKNCKFFRKTDYFCGHIETTL